MLGWYGGRDVGGLTCVLPCGSSPGANDITIVLDLSWWYSWLSRSAATPWGTEFCSKKISNMYNCMLENTTQKHKILKNTRYSLTDIGKLLYIFLMVHDSGQ